MSDLSGSSQTSGAGRSPTKTVLHTTSDPRTGGAQTTLARPLARMLELDSEQRRRLGQAARVTIGLFSLHRVAQQYDAFYGHVRPRQALSMETHGSFDPTRGGTG